jgi:glutamate/tyrosine decarboxylase-like PLP-dependent enzyme
MESCTAAQFSTEGTNVQFASILEKCRELPPFRLPSGGPIPRPEDVTHARDALKAVGKKVPEQGKGEDFVFNLLTNCIFRAVHNHSSDYYGFVVGGVTNAARLADFAVSYADVNPSVHFPTESIATEVEDYALMMLLDLLQLEESQWPGRTVTTGATASNILALACAREYLASGAGQIGIAKALANAGLQDIQILSCKSHSSLGKAASVVGFGRSSVMELSDKKKLWDFDLVKLEAQLVGNKTNGIGSIVAVNFGEVNTGLYTSRVPEIRQLCDKYGAWLHIDGAFGAYVRALRGSSSKFAADASKVTEGLELADSITGDGHKTLNVPYDCGFYFTKHPEIMSEVFQNPGAAYLSTSADSVPSPLNIGLENSRRFRALAVYATLVSYGKEQYCEFLDKMIHFSRQLSSWVAASPDYELLLERPESAYTVVLLRAKDEELNRQLKERVNSKNEVYVTGTQWEGRPAMRVAPCNWNMEKTAYLKVQIVLENVANEWRESRC